MPELPTPDPTVTVETQPYFDAAADGRLVLPKCTSCGELVWYPRAFCPFCASNEVEWVSASGRGSVYSYTVSYRGEGAYREAAPYVLAYVELDEGPRLLTNIVDCDPESVRVGQPVDAVFHPTPSGGALLRFRPTS